MQTGRSRSSPFIGLVVALVTWGAAVAALAEVGVYRMLPNLLTGPIIVLGIAAPVVGYARSARLRATLGALGLRWLTGFHVWRIAAALVFFYYGAHDVLPPAFAFNAGVGDLIAGVLALIVVIFPSRARYLAFHIVGFADFVVAVGTGLTLFLLGDDRMSAIQVLPLALIPLWGVGISGASHLIAFDLLRRSRQNVQPRLRLGKMPES